MMPATVLRNIPHDPSVDQTRRIGLAWLSLWVAVLAGALSILTWPVKSQRGAIENVAGKPRMAAQPFVIRPPPPLPIVAAPPLHAIDADKARVLNAQIPFAVGSNPAASPFRFAGGTGDLARATDCLASAQIYEAGDDAAGERAVAQVVLNRVRHPAFPKTICGVVFQGQERRTGCQFTFTCDGSLARAPSQAAWDRARAIARTAIGGAVFDRVGLATHYHTDWVLPYWSDSLDKTARVGTHLFFRWAGWWGTPPAFREMAGDVEPVIGRIARLSPAHLSPAHRDGEAQVLVAGAGAQARAPVTMDGAAMPPANKIWTPAPAVPLPGGVRRIDPVEIVEGGPRKNATVIALGALPR